MQRALLIIPIFLLVGAVLNVIVSWECALRGHRPSLFGGAPTPLSPTLDGDDLSYWKHRPPTWPATPQRYDEKRVHFGRVEKIMCTMQRSKKSDHLHLLRKLETGFPLPSLECGEWIHSMSRDGRASAPEVSRSHAISLPAAVDRWGVYLLPLRPKWFGFTANTLLYAFWSWCLVACIVAAGRRIFRKPARDQTSATDAGQPHSNVPVD